MMINRQLKYSQKNLNNETRMLKINPFYGNIQNIQKMIQSKIVETNKTSELLYNELKDKNTILTSLNTPTNLDGNNNTQMSMTYKSNNIVQLVEQNPENNTKLNPYKKDLQTILTLNQLKNKESKSTSLISNRNTLSPYINSFTQFNKKLVKEQDVFYHFNKSNNLSYQFLLDKTSKFLQHTFLAMGCLISKPKYSIQYTNNNLEFEHDTLYQDYNRNFTQKIIIHLHYFIRKNKKRYLNNSVEVSDQIIHISHPDNLDLPLLESTPLPQTKETKDKNNNINFSNSMNNQIKVSQRNNILCKYNDKFQFLTDYLSSVYKSEVELDLVRLHKVFYDGHILVQDIALKSYKFRFVRLVSKLFKRLHIQKLNYSNSLNKLEGFSFPSYLSGINIKLAGRTFRQRVIPRMTVKRIQKGSLTNVNVQFLDKARFTGKTRRGAYSFTITLGHVFK